MNLGISLGLCSGLQSLFSPQNLLAGSTALAWYDPSDLTTLFQDAAGTTPVTAPGQPVGLALDKSGNGFHATASGTSRPTYGVVPSRGRVNLLTFTNSFESGFWNQNATATTANQVVAPDSSLTADRTVELATTALHRISLFFDTGLLASPYTFSVYAKANGARRLGINSDVAIKSTALFDLTGDGTVVATEGVASNRSASIQAVGNGWYRCSVVGTGSNAGAFSIFLQLCRDTFSGIDDTYLGDGTSGIDFWGAQLELGSTATAYQRVGSQFEVTDPVGFPTYPCHYLGFDGIDDFMQTPTITPNADKVQVFAGVRKLSDGANGVIVESSTDIGTNSGTFGVLTLATSSYRSNSRGTALAQATRSAPAAPSTSVVTALGDIVAPSNAVRVDGVQTTVTTSQGTGNYLAYPVYIGRKGNNLSPFNGQLFSLIVRFSTSNLDASLVSQTERWMAQKTPGVTIA